MTSNNTAITQALAGTAGTSATNGSGASPTRSTGSMLGKDDFLKLLVGQLQHQDPMAPSDDQQWIGQMAQFSQLEQVSNTAQDTARIASELGRSGALGLIGRTVTYDDADGNAQTGVVGQVDIGSDGKATLTVDGTGGIDAGAVSQVR